MSFAYFLAKIAIEICWQFLPQLSILDTSKMVKVGVSKIHGSEGLTGLLDRGNNLNIQSIPFVADTLGTTH